jgi:hypothetical protein
MGVIHHLVINLNKDLAERYLAKMSHPTNKLMYADELLTKPGCEPFQCSCRKVLQYAIFQEQASNFV